MKNKQKDPPSESSTKRLKSEMRVFYGPSRDTVLFGFSVDISTGGLFLETDSKLQQDENLVLRFTLPEQGQTVSCNARVAWVNEAENPRKPELPPGVGVQFVDLSLDAMKAIKRFLQYNEIEPKW